MRYDANSIENRQIQKRAAHNFNKTAGPRVGDFIQMRNGDLKRFCYDWDDAGLQVTPAGSGSFFMGKSGLPSFSGGLEPCVPRAEIEDTGAMQPGSFWHFDNGWMRAGADVRYRIPCRVFKQV